ncbi:divergent protein kinase domain 1C-like [Branchiostoma floridae]|uniref:Divergent protein kinase domain 1C-like n=1 Tax=Branchiostoma floridae TaxID=7739 RepID=A0A9J7M3R1_BRAFL|nr:divergent protein kinase domain 1C-like [Branchiostoma floridae]
MVCMARSRTRKRLCKLVLAGLSILLLLSCLFVRRKVKARRCTDQESRATLRTLCEEYTRNKVTGNLCPDLCTTHSIIYRQCLNYRKGKKVMLAEWNTHKVILKSKYDRLQDYNSIVSRYMNDVGKMVTSPPDMATFLTMVKHQLRTMFEIDTPDISVVETLQKMCPWKKGKTLNQVTMESLWALLQQDEYLMMQYFQGNEHFPKIYGSCGHFYVMEYTPPGDTLSPSLFNFKTGRELVSSTDWDSRAKVALSFLTFLEDLNTFHTEPLHLCDVKQDNYGVSADLTIQAIDVDMAFFEMKMRGILGQENCTKNEDCEFFDCLSTCDLQRKRCSKHRSNNNLQAICKKIFVGYNGLPFGGLLRSPPAAISDRLDNALQECVKPSDNYGQSQKASSETLEMIRDLLQESLHSNAPSR